MLNRNHAGLSEHTEPSTSSALRASKFISLRSFWNARNILELCLFICFCLCLGFYLVHAASSMDYFWQWYRLGPVLLYDSTGVFWGGVLWQGVLATLRLSAISLFFALIIALVVTEVRMFGSFVEKPLALGYVQFIRNTPLMVQILFAYFVVAPLFGWDAETSAVIAISLFEGAYLSEIFRGGVLSVATGQWEAGYSLGLPRHTVLFRIILPQALRNALPPLLSQSVTLVKDTSLASAISVAELTYFGKTTVANSFLTLEIWLSVGLVYLVLSLGLGFLAFVVRILLEQGHERYRHS